MHKCLQNFAQFVLLKILLYWVHIFLHSFFCTSVCKLYSEYCAKMCLQNCAQAESLKQVSQCSTITCSSERLHTISSAHNAQWSEQCAQWYSPYKVHKTQQFDQCTQVEQFTRGACTICLRITTTICWFGWVNRGLEAAHSIRSAHFILHTHCTPGANSRREKWKKKLVALHIVEYPTYCKYSG